MYSIVICTRNRAPILEICVSTLVSTWNHKTKGNEILVIDNNSSDDTEQVIERYSSRDLSIIYIKEEKVGLSHARNLGVISSKNHWVIFIDDDCYVEKNFFLELEKTIVNFSFDAFTGNYLPWFRSSKPKWISNDFGRKSIKAIDIMEIEHPDFFSGGIMAFKKSALIDIGLFPSVLGMQGKKISYGEETYVEERLKVKNYSLGINPNWIIFHLVREEKMTLRWQLIHKYAQARDDVRIRGSENIFRLVFKPFYVLGVQFIPRTKDLLCKKDYYWQNYVLDLLEYFAFNSGRIVGRYLSKKLP